MKISGAELGLLAATRGMLGAGIGMLAAGRMADPKRRRVGRILLSIGAASTIPLFMRIVGRQRRHSEPLIAGPPL